MTALPQSSHIARPQSSLCAYLAPAVFDCVRCKGAGGVCGMCGGKGYIVTEPKTGGHPRNLGMFYRVDPECALKKLRRMTLNPDPHVRHAAARFAYQNNITEFEAIWRSEGYGR